MRWAVLFLLLVLVPPAVAQPEDTRPVEKQLSDPALEGRARALQKELRCLVCQGQSIDESNAPLAADLRMLVREHVIAGESDQEIKDYLVARYGAFVLMKPPVRGDTLLLWFAPLLLLVVGLGVAGTIVLRSRNRLAGEPVSGEAQDSP